MYAHQRSNRKFKPTSPINMVKVIIAEKPSVARSIAAVIGATTRRDGYLEGNGYQVTWAYGHLITLCEPREPWSIASLPIIPEKWQTEPVGRFMKGKRQPDSGIMKQLRTISTLFKTASQIICATDSGREGQLIFRYIYEYLSENDNIRTPCKRLWISSLTDKAIKEGMAHLLPDSHFNHLSDAAKGRAQADWLVGMNATRSLTLTIQARNAGSEVYSIGRVQTPTLCMVCKRYFENRDFISSPYYILSVQTEKEKKILTAKNPTKFKTREEAQHIITKVTRHKALFVTNVTRKDTSEAPPLLFDLTSLQQAANIKNGLSANETLTAAQSLYEAGYITYPRTGSRYIPDDVYDELPRLLCQLRQYDTYAIHIPSLQSTGLSRRSVDTGKITDHHAILPTGTLPGNNLNKNEQVIYDLVISRLLESISMPCLKSVTNITLISPDCPDYPFYIRGYTITSPGWYIIRRLKDTNEKNEDEEPELPLILQNEQLPLLQVTLLDKKTKAPALLTEAALLSMMESCGKEIENDEEREAIKALGIGTPATRAAIIENLLSRNAIARVKKSLIPTGKGIAIYDNVKDLSLANVSLTGKWEHALQLVEQGKLPIDLFNEQIITFTHQIVRELTGPDIKFCEIPRSGETGTICPKCKKQQLKIYPNRVFCPDDKCNFYFYPIIAGRQLTNQDITALCEKGKTEVLHGFKSKAGKSFSKALEFDEHFKPVFVNEPVQIASDFLCPRCKSALFISPTCLFCKGPECKFVLFRTVSGHLLTDKEIIGLFTYKRTDVITFQGKKGKLFKAYLTLTEDFRIDFVF